MNPEDFVESVKNGDAEKIKEALSLPQKRGRLRASPLSSIS